MKQLLLIFSFFCIQFASFASTTFNDGLFTFTIIGDNSVSVAGNTNYTLRGDYVIPTTVKYNSVTYSVTRIENDGFNAGKGGFTKEMTSVVIPNSVVSIGNRAFSGCAFTSINIPSSVTSIGYNAFYKCSTLSNITIPTSVTTIGFQAFHDTKWWNDKPGGVIYINQIAYAFKGSKYSGLSIELNDNTISISEYAFVDCSGLPDITIPSSVTSIGRYAFLRCSGLRKIISKMTTLPTVGDSIFGSVNKLTCQVIVPQGELSLYATALQWKDFKNISDGAPTIISTPVLNIASTTASGGGKITYVGTSPITARGVCWSTVANPTTSNNKTIDGTGTGSFTSSITGLLPGTIYHIRAYATNGAGTSYGEDLTFTTPTTPSYDLDVTNTYLTNPGFDLNCNYLYNATAANLAAANGTANDLTVAGWTMTANSWTAAAAFECGYTGKLNNSTIPTLASDGKSTGSGVGVLGVNAGWGGKVIYYQTVTLPAGKYKIIYTAYNSSSSPAAISKVGWTTSATDSILSTVTSFPQNVWVNDTIPFTLTMQSAGKILVGMQSQNTSSGSNGKIFFDYIKLIKTVDQTAPTITTTTASSILAKSASSGGNITSDGGSAVTARGVCWSTTANPTITNSKTTDGTGNGLYSSSITGLLPLTTYHIRAYATNSVGTAYGSDLTFTTLYNTALNDVQASNLDIYPNPSNGILNIKFENSTPLNSVVSLYNLVGQKIYTQQINAIETQLNVTGYNLKGVYLLTVEDERGKVCSDRKIVFK